MIDDQRRGCFRSVLGEVFGDNGNESERAAEKAADDCCRGYGSEQMEALSLDSDFEAWTKIHAHFYEEWLGSSDDGLLSTSDNLQI